MKTRYVAIALAATMGLGSVSAFAQGRHDGRGQGAWQHQRADRGNWNHHNAPRYYAPSYRRHDNGDVVGAVVLGALAGAVLGQAANGYNYAPPAAYYSPPATYYGQAPTYYAQPPAYYNPGYGYGYYGP